MKMKKILVEIPIIRSKYNKTKSAKFKGKLSIVSNEYGIIYDWHISFDSVHIDLCTTASWFEDGNKNLNFNRRELLFSKLGISQIPRLKGCNELIEMNEKQLVTLNEYFNDRDVYDSTIKNIVAVLKGNNPGGEAKKPSSAELIIDGVSGVENFVILLDDLTMKNKVNYGAVALGLISKTIKEYAALNTQLSEAFNYMQKQKGQNDWRYYLQGIKDYYKAYCVDETEAIHIANKARSRYNSRCKDIERFPFGFTTSKEFQCCHIYEFFHLRDHIIKSMREKLPYAKYEKQIEDPENFLPLPETIHRQFDRNELTYKENGEIWALTATGQEFINDSVDYKFHKIDSWFITKERKEYLTKRNHLLM